MAALITVDWGTTACRAARLDSHGHVVDRLDGGAGILGVTNGAFEPALEAFLAPWLASSPPPIILSGMIGSRQGWVEAPYVRCPAGLSEVARQLTWIDSARLGRIGLIPGLDVHPSGSAPDVMRGEETQIFGAFDTGHSGLAILPGTHSKWVTIDSGRIADFRTFMTGEVFSALKDHTILGRLMQPSAGFDEAAFLRGVAAGAAPGSPGALLNRIFATRTLGLFDKLPASGLADYLSGLLIGAEIQDNRGAATHVTILGSEALTQRYRLACMSLGLQPLQPPADTAALGAARVAVAAGLVTFTTASI
jgi:2-dehydro-3-deoxygalactonokinase